MWHRSEAEVWSASLRLLHGGTVLCYIVVLSGNSKGGLYSSLLYGGLALLSGIALCCMGVVCYMMAI